MDDLHKRAEILLQEQSEAQGQHSSEETQRLIHNLRVHQIELELQNEELRRTQTALEASRNRYIELYDFAPVGYLTIDAKGLITEVNLTCTMMLGIERNTLLFNRTIFHLIVKEDTDIYYRHRQKVLDSKLPQSCELRLRGKEGTHFYAHLECRPVFGEEEQVTHIRIAVTDISELKALLQEKARFMQEILHRTKNNMTSICSLLYLQSALIEDEQMVRILEETQNRVQSMALVQQKLYLSQDFAHLDLKEYLIDLASTLFRNLRVGMQKVSLKFDLEPVSVSHDTAIPCGLILNELMTNALKYAFPGERRGAILVVLHPKDTGEIEFGVRDTGVGMPENVEHTDSLGLKLVTMFAEKQLRGTITHHIDNGTEFLIRFMQREHQ